MSNLKIAHCRQYKQKRIKVIDKDSVQVIIFIFYCCHYKLSQTQQLKGFPGGLVGKEQVRQYKFIALQCWRSEVQNGSHWAKIQVLVGLNFFWWCQRRLHFLAFPASRDTTSLGSWSPFSIFKAHRVSQVLLTLHPSDLAPSSSLPLPLLSSFST